MNKNQTKIAKLAIETDVNIIGESFIVKTDKDLIAKLGTLFGIVEVYNTDDNFSHKLLETIGDLKTEFYLPPYGIQISPQKRFEEALARANRRLFLAFNESIQPIDLRNINVTVGLLRKNEIYLSQIGQGKAFLFHRKKNWEILILDILSDDSQINQKPNPEKLFSSVLSGSLNEKDALLICNEEFLNYFSQKELAENIEQKIPEDFFRYLGNQIKEKSAKSNFYAIAIKIEPEEKPIEEFTKSSSITKNATQHSIDKLLKTKTETEKYLTPSMASDWKKAIIISKNLIKKFGLFILTKTQAIIINGFNFIQQKLKQNKSNQIDINNTKNQLSETNKQFTNDQLKISSALSQKNDNALKATTTTTASSIIKTDQQLINQGFFNKKNKKFITTINKLPTLINDWLNNQIIKFLSLKLSQKIILSLALILLFFFSQTVVWIGRAEELSSPQNSPTDKIVQEIRHLIDNAEAQNIFNDEAGALHSIKQAQELLEKIPKRWTNKDLRQELAEKITNTYRKLQKITTIDNPRELINLGEGNFVGLARTDDSLWSFNNNTKELISIKETGVIVKKLKLEIPEIKNLLALDNHYLAILTQDNSFYRYNISKNQAVKTKPSKDYFNIKYPTPSPLLDPPITTTTYSIVSGELYYLLDNSQGRIIILNKNGAIKRQYYSEKIKSATTLIANTKNKKLWFLAGNSLYEIITEI